MGWPGDMGLVWQKAPSGRREPAVQCPLSKGANVSWTQFQRLSFPRVTGVMGILAALGGPDDPQSQVGIYVSALHFSVQTELDSGQQVECRELGPVFTRFGGN